MNAAAAPPEVVLRRVLLNGGALFGAYVVPRSLTFVAALCAARVLLPSAFGTYGAVAALAMMLSIACTLGMLPLLVRDMARSPADARVLVAAAHRVKQIAGVMMLVVLVSVARAAGFPRTAVLATFLLGVGHIAWALAENYGARLQAEERMRGWLYANIVFGVCSGVLAGAAVVLTQSIVWFCAGFAAGQGAALLYLFATERVGPVAEDRLRYESRRLARATAPYALAFLCLTIFYKFDVLLLARLGDLYAAGIYAAGYKLVDVLHALAVVAAAAVYPRLARTAGGVGARRTLELFVLGAVPVGAALWLVRDAVVSLAFGAAYTQTVAALSLLAPAAALLMVNIAGGYLLAIENRLRQLATAYAVALAVKFALAVLWMPSHGAFGAAGAMLAGEVIVAALLGSALHRAGVRLPRPRIRLAALGAAGLALPCATLQPLPGLVLFGAGVLLLYGAAGAITRTERGIIALAFRRTARGTLEPT